jgi:5-methylcytosine-specific restriction endonuclease McrA
MKSKEEKADDIRIFTLFRGRCVACFGVGTEIHELITRARTKQALTLKNNRVPLCRSCHNKAHSNGYTEVDQDFLKNRAIELLIRFDVELALW